MTGPRESRLLIDEPPLQVLPSLAKEVGLNDAIVIQQVHYWLKQSKNVHDGKTWIYNSYKEWKEQFPFWPLVTIQRIFKRLEDNGYLIVGNYNKHPFDRTKWYRIDYTKLTTSSYQNDTLQDIETVPSEDINLIPPIPETTQETNPENSISSTFVSEIEAHNSVYPTWYELLRRIDPSGPSFNHTEVWLLRGFGTIGCSGYSC